MTIDYSLYLVTGRELLPEEKTYRDYLSEALKGGVTVVQVREKKIETAEFLRIAQETKDICRARNIPVIINDRIDIALAIDADGVHLGQTDMPMHVAKKLLPGKIIGVSCNTIDHVRKAVEDGADYIGIGAVWATDTKVTSPVLGVQGVRELLTALGDVSMKTVAIGGINYRNILEILQKSVSTTGRKLDGVAVVSDVAASPQPFEAAQRLRGAFQSWSENKSASIV